MIQKVLVQRLGVHKHHVFNSMDILISFLMEKSIRRNLGAHNKRTNQQKTYDELEKRTLKKIVRILIKILTTSSMF